MQNINLKTDESAIAGDKKKTDKNIVIALVILLFLFLLYGGIFAAARFLDSKIADVNGQYMAEYSAFTAGNANEVLDFENRGATAKGLIAGEESATLTMGQIENTMVPSVYLTSYKYDKNKKTVTLKAVADNFNTLAKQVLSFKESDYFSSVTLGPSAFDKDNKLNFSAILIRK